MDRSPQDSPPSDQDPNSGDQDPNLPSDDQASPPDDKPSLKRRRPERGGSYDADKRQGKRPVSETNSPTIPAISKKMEMVGGSFPYTGSYQPTACDHTSFIELLKEREMRLEDKAFKLHEKLSKITEKHNAAKRNITMLKKEKKAMETSRNAVVRKAVGKIKKKARMHCKKWIVKKRKEARYAIKYFEMESGLKMINRFRAGNLNNRDLDSEEQRMKFKQMECLFGVALLTSSFLDESDSSDDDAGPSGTALEPNPDSSDDELDE